MTEVATACAVAASSQLEKLNSGEGAASLLPKVSIGAHLAAFGYSTPCSSTSVSSFSVTNFLVLSARQKDLSWKEHLDALRELTATPDSRGDGGGAQPLDAVLAARERRAAKRARQQAAEVVGAHSPAEPAAHDKRESAGARHTAKDTSSEELWGCAGNRSCGGQ